MLPGTEFSLIRTEVTDAAPVEVVVAPGDTSYVVAARAAEFLGLPRGSREIRVYLLDAAGTQVGIAGETIEQEADAAMTFRISSAACADIGCPVTDGDPDESVCYRGRCVEPSCLDTDTPECPAPECVEDAECPLSCLRARCGGGQCICYSDAGPSCDEITCGANATCDDRLRQPCACDDGYDGDGFTCTNIDECALATDACDPDATCADTDGGYTCECPGGELGDGFTCEDGCADGTAGCSANASCEMTEAGPVCECLGGYSGDGTTCERGEVLVIASCEWLVPAVDCGYADDAAEELGYDVRVVHGDPDAAAAGAITSSGWDLIVMDSWDTLVRSQAELAFAMYSRASGRFIFSQSDLDVLDRYIPMGIEAVEYSGWRDVHSTPVQGVDLFDQLEEVPTLGDSRGLSWARGQDLTTTEPDGFLVGRSGTAAGPGAIAVTNEGRAIVNGFSPYNVGDRDADSDSRPDAQELYLNEITYLLAPRILVYAETAPMREAAEAMVSGAGYAVVRADAGDLEAVIGVGDLAAIVALRGDATPATVSTALASWATGGGHLIVGGASLAGDSALQAALEVTATATTGAHDLFSRSAFGPSFFNLVERAPGPVPGVVATTELAGTGADALVTAHFDDRAGPGATVITRGGAVIVNGFDFPATGVGADGDGDGLGDALELLRNEIHYVAR